MGPRLLGVLSFTLIAAVIVGGLIFLSPADWPMFLFAIAVVTFLGAAPVVFSVLSRRKALHGSVRARTKGVDDHTVVVVKDPPPR